MSVTYSGRYDAIVVGVGGWVAPPPTTSLVAASVCSGWSGSASRTPWAPRTATPVSSGWAYYEHPSYVLLLKRAYELWREIQRTAGERLLHITGSIDAGPEDSWVFKGSWESCRLHDLPHEVLTGAELHRRYPGYHLPADHLALVQQRGWLPHA